MPITNMFAYLFGTQRVLAQQEENDDWVTINSEDAEDMANEELSVPDREEDGWVVVGDKNTPFKRLLTSLGNVIPRSTDHEFVLVKKSDIPSWRLMLTSLILLIVLRLVTYLQAKLEPQLAEAQKSLKSRFRIMDFLRAKKALLLS